MAICSRIVHPRQKLQDMRMRLDDHSIRLLALIKGDLTRHSERLAHQQHMLKHVSPAKAIASLQEQVSTLQDALAKQINRLIREGQDTILKNVSMLDALNPLAILQRGYSITRTLPDRSVVRSAKKVTIDQNLEIRLGRGQLTVTVTGRNNGAD